MRSRALRFAAVLPLLALAVSSGETSRAAAGPAQPNVVIFLVDDMGVMDTSLPFLTGAEGQPKKYPLNEFYRTPNMERMAARGIRFNNFCAMSVCSPSRISILTGQNAARHRTTNWIHPDQDNRGSQGPPDWNWKGLKKGDITLPGLLRGGGYRTIHVGKAHLGPRQFEGAEPLNLGFDVNVAGCSIGQPGSYYGERNYGGTGKRQTHAVPGLEAYHGTGTFLTEALTIEAKTQISRAVKDGVPFFLHFAHYAVHAPFDPDPRFAAHYTNSGKSAQAQAFATLIEGMDKSLGDILDCLDALGVAENTLVFFLGDNGSDAPLGPEHEVACAAPLRGKKGTQYEGGMRVPFIAAWAKPMPDHPVQRRLPVAAGVVQSRQAAVYDLFPTILGLAGIAAPAGHALDGARLDTLLTGKRDAARSEEFLMHYPHGPHRSSYFTSFRRGAWKAIYHYVPSKDSGGARYELFNLAADPFEQTDVAASEPARLREMMQGLIAGLEKQGAVYPVDPDTGAVLKPRPPGDAP
ncbi:MAG: sulfatase-like hydrolase/transferase [Verrucomicrobia bacterium]|nr:sulfatase-like hydrolase/transferase [Verrucomicrobiota bacterium]